MVRKEIVDKMGGFDENTFMYSEDRDLCFRILQDGWKIYYLSDDVIIHYQGSATEKAHNTNFSIIMSKQANYYFFHKHYGRAHAGMFRFITAVGSLSRIFITPLVIPLSSLKFIKKDRNHIEIINKYSTIFLWSLGLQSRDNNTR